MCLGRLSCSGLRTPQDGSCGKAQLNSVHQCWLISNCQHCEICRIEWRISQDRLFWILTLFRNQFQSWPLPPARAYHPNPVRVFIWQRKGETLTTRGPPLSPRHASFAPFPPELIRWFCRQNSLFPSLLENVSGYTGGYYNTTNISDPMLRTGVSLIKRKLVIYLSRLFPPAHNMKSLILSLVPATRYFPSQVSLLRRLQIHLRLSMVHWLTWTGCGTPCCKYIPSPLLGDAPLRLRPPDLTPTWAAVKKHLDKLWFALNCHPSKWTSNSHFTKTFRRIQLKTGLMWWGLCQTKNSYSPSKKTKKCHPVMIVVRPTNEGSRSLLGRRLGSEIFNIRQESFAHLQVWRHENVFCHLCQVSV